MDKKTYSEIMNRIRKLAKENGEVLDNVIIKITLINSETLTVAFDDIAWQGDYIEAWNQERFNFVPLKNILAIQV